MTRVAATSNSCSRWRGNPVLFAVESLFTLAWNIQMLDGLTAYAHHVRLLVEPLLHRLDNGLMFPALYPASLFA
ncbi:hypothetical protein OKW40_001769 [Paraburkholderia sp. RAU6.4a]|uniref:hypothetical protein n=1 Tax=Paraburkholderia sp. RAU6.4a TaxID=2991067 RepID=UPI003D24D780